jgi:hypothetical protein
MWPVGQQTLLRRFARGVISDLQAILACKRALRREMAARPVAEELRMLNALHECALCLEAVR